MLGINGPLLHGQSKPGFLPLGIWVTVVEPPWQRWGMRALFSALQGENPFELAFSLEQAHPGETDFSLECPARPGEGPGGRGSG